MGEKEHGIKVMEMAISGEEGSDAMQFIDQV